MSSVESPATQLVVQPLMNQEKEQLYQAQSIANQVVKSHLFPCYSTHYIQSQNGVKKAAFQGVVA